MIRNKNNSHAKQIRFFPGESLTVLLEQLESRREGLTTSEAIARLDSLGMNIIAPRHVQTTLSILADSIINPLVLILLAAALASFFLGEVVNAVIIITMVFLSVSINFWQSSNSARAVRQLQSQITPTATVLQDGVPIVIPRQEIAIGDVIQLAAGDLIPADGRLLEATDLHVQQAALTGESFPVEKKATEQPLSQVSPQAEALVFVGTSVVSGTATAVVFATGETVTLLHASLHVLKKQLSSAVCGASGCLFSKQFFFLFFLS